MKNAKRILSGILALVMVLMLCPVIALAEETTDVTVDIAAMANDKNYITLYGKLSDKHSVAVTIP